MRKRLSDDFESGASRLSKLTAQTRISARNTIEPSRYDVDMYDGADGVTVYDVRMIMNCGECNMHMIGPDGIADSIDDAEDTARILLIRKWNVRWTPSDRDADELV